MTSQCERKPIEHKRAEIACMMFDQGWGTAPEWRQVWKQHATEKMVGYFHGDPEPNCGLEAHLAFQAALFEGFPDLKTHITAVTTEEDTVVVQSRLSGAQTGPFLGYPASNRSVDVPDVTIFRFDGEKICEVRYFTDLLRVMQTIGAVQAS